MCPLFKPREQQPAPTSEPVPHQFPRIEGAAIAADTYGPRVGGDFYDSLRVGPQRVLFGLLDLAGRRASNQAILSAAQKMFYTLGAQLFSQADFNEAEAMTQLSIRLNRGLMEAAGGVISCPAFIGCYHEQFGTLCYTNAGHTPGLMKDSTGIVELGSTGLPWACFRMQLRTRPRLAWRRVRRFFSSRGEWLRASARPTKPKIRNLAWSA